MEHKKQRKLIFYGGTWDVPTTETFVSAAPSSNSCTGERLMFVRVYDTMLNVLKVDSWFITDMRYIPDGPNGYCHKNCDEWRTKHKEADFARLDGWLVVATANCDTKQSSMGFMWHSVLWKPGKPLVDITTRLIADPTKIMRYLGFIPDTVGSNYHSYIVDAITGKILVTPFIGRPVIDAKEKEQNLLATV